MPSIFRLSPAWKIFLSCLSLVTALLFTRPSIATLASPEAIKSLAPSLLVKAKPKLFICPAGMYRDAVAVTENYQVNLCSQAVSEVSKAAVRNAINRQRRNLPVNTNDDVVTTAEISVVSMRNIKTKKQINLPVSTKDDVIYTAQGKAYNYQFDFGKRLLTIQSAQGQKTVEKILSSD